MDYSGGYISGGAEEECVFGAACVGGVRRKVVRKIKGAGSGGTLKAWAGGYGLASTSSPNGQAKMA